MEINIPFLNKKSKTRQAVEVETGEVKAQDIIAPSFIEIKQNHLMLGERMAKTFFIFSYPRYLSTGWLSPIINLDAPLDVSMHIHPTDAGNILKKLRKKVTEVQAEISEREGKGLVRDPSLDIAYQDIEQLRDELQTARERVFRLGLYITIYGDTEKELREVETVLRSILESRLIYLKPALMREKHGFISSCPYALDQLLVNTPMNTGPLSSIFPFVSPDLSANEGILYGINQHNNSLVLFDRFSLENANCTIFATSGAGKSIEKDTPVLIKDKKGDVKLTKIGPLIENTIQKQGIDFRDEELEGKTFPGMKVWTFDENMKGEWGEVKIAARKLAPKDFYKFKTQSGREITTTGDHNLVALKNGRVELLRGDEVKKGEYIPLPKSISIENNKVTTINLLELLCDRDDIYIKGADRLIEKHYKFLKKQVIDEKFDRYLYMYRVGRFVPIKYYLKLTQAVKEKNINDVFVVSKKGNGGIPSLLEVTDELLRIMGYIASEGIITDKFIGISNIDEEFLLDLESCFKKLNILYFRTKKGINVGSIVFVEMMKIFSGCGRSGDKFVAPFVFGLSKQQVAQYLSAYFEGDGGVDSGAVTATSKSEKLISETAYLLCYFGIVARVRKTMKKPTNSNWKKKKAYWVLSISGQDDLRKFTENINFISERKRKALDKIIQKTGNTNVDIVPDVVPIFQEIYSLFSFGLRRVNDISNLKRNHFQPSPTKLKEMVAVIEERIQQFKDRAPTYQVLSEIPSLAEIIDLGKNNKEFNRDLWKVLGHSWHVVKYRGVKPGFTNANKMIQVVMGRSYEMASVKQAVYSGFKETDLEFKSHSTCLQQALKNYPQSNTCYDMIQRGAQHVWQRYQEILNDNIPQVEEKLKQLKVLANSNLFWDPIVKVEKIENKKDKYVYDLTCENSVFLAGKAGMFVHNSYFVKLEILRYLMQNLSVIIIDPENEYEFLSDAVGGSYFKISLNSDNHLNPFALPIPREGEDLEDVLRSNIINLVGLLRIMLGGLSAEEDAIIDQALSETYAAKDITPDTDPSTWGKNTPLMSDFESVLSSMEGTESLLKRVRKFTKGSYARFFNSPSNVDMTNPFVVFGIRDMEESLRPIAMFIILRYIWSQIRSTMKKRILLVDEAWWIMQTEDGASFLFGLCKRARKYWLGVTTVTQDVSDFMKSDYGRPIITNSSLQFLMKQSPATIDDVQKTFNLTDGEKSMLLSSDVGEGIFIAGQKRVALKVVASYTEDQLITSSPEEVQKLREAKRNAPQAPPKPTRPEKTIRIEDKLKKEEPEEPEDIALGIEKPISPIEQLSETAESEELVDSSKIAERLEAVEPKKPEPKALTLDKPEPKVKVKPKVKPKPKIPPVKPEEPEK